MGKDHQFDCSSGIIQQPCPRTDVKSCITLYTVVQLNGEVCPFLQFQVLLTSDIFHPRSSRICVVLCTVLQLCGEGCPF